MDRSGHPAGPDVFGERSPSGLWRRTGNAVRGNPSRVRIPPSPPPLELEFVVGSVRAAARGRIGSSVLGPGRPVRPHQRTEATAIRAAVAFTELAVPPAVLRVEQGPAGQVVWTPGGMYREDQETAILNSPSASGRPGV